MLCHNIVGTIYPVPAFGPQPQPAAAPVFDPQLHQAMLMMFQAMTAQIQHGMMAVQAPAPALRLCLLTVPTLNQEP